MAFDVRVQSEKKFQKDMEILKGLLTGVELCNPFCNMQSTQSK
jgi:hypothetical protein